MILMGKQKDSVKKPFPEASLSITNSTWPDVGINLGLQSEKLVTDHLNSGTVFIVH
jgi:hypothetical protein